MSAKDTADAMDSIVDALYAANKPALGLVGKFGELTSESAKMQIIMRFLSGTGAWRFLNKMKAIGMMIKGYNEGLNQAAKAQAEAAKEYANEIKARSKLVELQETLNKSNAAELLQKDEMFIGLKEMYGTKMALQMLQEDSNKALDRQNSKLKEIKESHMDNDKILTLAHQKAKFNEKAGRWQGEGGKFISGEQGTKIQEMQEMAKKRGLGKVGEDGLFKEFGGFKKMFTTRFAKISRVASSFGGFLSGTGKMIKHFLKVGLLALGNIIIWGLVIILAIILLKPVIVKFMDFFSESLSAFGVGWESFYAIFENLFDNLEVVWGAAAHFLGVLFDPNATMMDAVWAFADFLMSVWKLQLDLLLDLFAALGPLTVALLAAIGELIAWPFIWMWKELEKLWIGFTTWLGDVKTSIIAKIALFVVLIKNLPKLIGNFIAKQIKKIPGFAAGGTVTSSGNILVGERGPEILNVPGASRITPNHAIKNQPNIVTNNITVEVKGRMGASDQEIREVARKVGAMINREINRTTSSGVRL